MGRKCVEIRDMLLSAMSCFVGDEMHRKTFENQARIFISLVHGGEYVWNFCGNVGLLRKPLVRETYGEMCGDLRCMKRCSVLWP